MASDSFGAFIPLPPGANPAAQPHGQGNLYREGIVNPTDTTTGWTPSIEPAQYLNTATKKLWHWFTDSGATTATWHVGSETIT